MRPCVDQPIVTLPTFFKNRAIYFIALVGLSIGLAECAGADYPKVITNKSLPKPIRSAARQCSANGKKVVFSNLDLTSQGFVYCPEAPKRWAILDSNANELIAPELEPIDPPAQANPVIAPLLPSSGQVDQRVRHTTQSGDKDSLSSFARVAEALGK